MTDVSRDGEKPLVVKVLPNPKNWFDELTKYVTFVVSIFALGLSLFSIKETLKHDDASITPILKVTSGVSSDGKSQQISIDNQGLGPASISNITVYFDDKTYKSFCSDDLDVAVNFIYKRDDITVNCQDSPDTGNVLTIPEKSSVIFWSAPSDAIKDNQFYDLVVHRLKVTLVYCTIYQKCAEFCGPDCDKLKKTKKLS